MQRPRVTPLVAAAWVAAALSTAGYAAVLWRAFRAATLPRVRIDGTAVPASVAAAHDESGGGAVTVLTTTGTIDVGCGEAFSGQGMALVRFDGKGTCRWKKPIRGASAVDVATAPDGDVVFVADVYANADFGFGPTPSFHSLAVTRLDAAGKPKWSRSLDARVAEVPTLRSRQVLAASGDAVALLVATHKDADLGTGKLVTRDSPRDAAVVLLDGATGTTRWVRYMGALSFGGVAFDGAGPGAGVLVIGSFVGDMDPENRGGRWHAADGKNGDLFVASLDAHGDTRVAKHFGPADGTCIAAGPGGHVFVAGGYAEPPLDLGGGALPTCAPQSSCAFFGELDASLALVGGGAIEDATPRRIAPLATGGFLVAGDVVAPAADASRPPEVFLRRVDRSAWFGTGLRRFHGTDHVDGLAIDKAGRAIVAGHSTAVRTSADVRWLMP